MVNPEIRHIPVTALAVHPEIESQVQKCHRASRMLRIGSKLEGRMSPNGDGQRHLESTMVTNATIPRPAAPTVFDKQHALARVGGLKDVLKDVMELMVTENPRVQSEMAAAHLRRDPTGMKRAAHTLKGSVSLVGATDLVRRLRRVEDCAATGDFDAAAQEFDEIDRQFHQLQHDLAQALQAD